MAASSPSLALPRSELHRPASLSSPSLAAWLPLMSVLVGILALLYLAQTSELTTTGYSIQQLQAEESNWKLRNEQVSLQLAEARSLAVVEKQATERLGMVAPEKLVYLSAPQAGADGRTAVSSRGQREVVAQLVKEEQRPEGNLLSPVSQTLSALLVPRAQ